MKNFLLISLGKLISASNKKFNLGEGSTWPGHLALKFNKSFIKDLIIKSNTKIVLIAGTNGKTTTGKIISAILKKNNFKIIHNDSGANLLNGIASTLLKNSNDSGIIDADYAIFEVDENTLPSAIEHTNPDYIICLNLFRDQLDRYGEIDTIAQKWKKSFESISNKTVFFLNGDDPLVASIGNNLNCKTYYFGLNDNKLAIKTNQNAADSIYCLNCKNKLTYKSIYFSHLGEWECKKCMQKRPRLDITSAKVYPLLGTYNLYNTLASVLFATVNKIPEKITDDALRNFKPAFGRQEKIKYKNSDFFVYLSKNPTSFNESLRTVKELDGKNLFIVLNDRIPDGKDVSWIYDIDFENLLNKNQNIIISGDRGYDMAIRIKYADLTKKYYCFEDLKKAVKFASERFENETIYALPTYSAMLDLRKILTGRKIF